MIEPSQMTPSHYDANAPPPVTPVPVFPSQQKACDDENEHKKFEDKYENWTEMDVALYLLSHFDINNQSEGEKTAVMELCKTEKLDGRKLKQMAAKEKEDEWRTIVDKIEDRVKLPVAEFIRGELHPTLTTLLDVPKKLSDCTQGIWFTAEKFFRRDAQYDQYYPENEVWCHDRNGRPYFSPAGWRRYGFYPKKDNETEEEVKEIMSTWHVAYHGTRSINVNTIVDIGLVPPGTVVGNKVIKNERGKAGAAKGKPIPIYLSPSIEYAAHWAYTEPVKKGEEHVYYVFQVRVRPQSFRMQGNTLWDGGWGDRKVLFDVRFGPDELEWLVEDPANIRVTGLMVKKDKTLPAKLIENKFKLHKEMCSNRRGPGKGKWFWNNAASKGPVLSPKGPWAVYKEDENEQIEKAYQNWQRFVYLGRVVTEVGPNKFYIDFDSMHQIRCDNNNLVRLVKREQV